MANTSDTFNNDNPNGVLFDTSARRGEALYNRLSLKTETIEFSIKGILEAEKELTNLNKKIDNVKSRATDGSLTQKQKKDLEEYAKSLEQAYESQKNRVDRLGQAYERVTGVNLQEEREILETEKELHKVEEDINYELEKIALKRKHILADSSLSANERAEKLQDLNDEEIARKNQKHQLLGERGERTSAVIEAAGENSFIGGFLSTLSDDRETSDRIEGIIANIGEHVPMLNEIGTLVNVTKSILSGLSALRQSMTKAINSAASQMASYYGVINANLENSVYAGSGKATDVIFDNADNALGINRFVKQTDYLNKIADLTNQGLVTDVEQRAILETIKNKTLTSFDVTNAGLTRLIRLGEQDSINQFGIELQLKRLLNQKLFGDSSYLSNLFDSVTSAIVDAGVATKSDITNFNSTIQTYLGAMYASGLSDNVVNAISTGINALGSGNVSALAQDENIQRLFLLSMDRIGMDYADVLQQGLSSSDTSKLLSSVIEYLNEIATNTSDNLVLKSSYSNLFNMSVSDMQAIQNVYGKLGSITSSIISSSQAQQNTVNAVSKNVEAYTLASEQWDTAIENLSYTFGANIAENSTMYNAYRIADITYNILDQLSGVGGVLGKTIGLAKAIPAGVQYTIGLGGLIPLIGDIGSFSGGSLVNLLQSTSSAISTTSSESSIKELNKTTISNKIGGLSLTNDDWGKEEDNETLGELKKITQALMKLKDGDGYAFAVSLQGMSVEVLKSFASIFADEDAMLKTFQGDNTVLTKALFDYFGDTTSNSTETTNSTTTEATT